MSETKEKTRIDWITESRAEIVRLRALLPDDIGDLRLALETALEDEAMMLAHMGLQPLQLMNLASGLVGADVLAILEMTSKKNAHPLTEKTE